MSEIDEGSAYAAEQADYEWRRDQQELFEMQKRLRALESPVRAADEIVFDRVHFDGANAAELIDKYNRKRAAVGEIEGD